MNNIHLQKGISLVETIVYVAIFSIIIVGLAQFSATLSSTRLHMQGVLEVNDQGSQAIKLITQTLRNGSSVNSPTIGSSGSSLSVVTNIPTTSPTVFSISSGVLYITEGAGSPVALTNNKVTVSNLIFSNFSRASTPGIIKVSLTITSTSARDPYSVTFDGSGALRK
jgi:Tfp pilus assembly protein PilW